MEIFDQLTNEIHTIFNNFIQNQIETKRDETKRNETKQNQTKPQLKTLKNC